MNQQLRPNNTHHVRPQNENSSRLHDSSSPSKSILFLDKVLVKGKRSTEIRGVELFNLSLIRELLELGYSLTLPAAKTWSDELSEYIKCPRFKVLWLPATGEATLKSLLASSRILNSSFDALFIANVGKSLVPSIYLLKRFGIVKHLVLLAHREPTGFFLRTLSKLPLNVIAVNEQIQRRFIASGFKNPRVYYGIINAKRFTNTVLEAKNSDIVNFGVLGKLENSWKGADTAVEAFRNLPQKFQAHARLHLAGFSSTPPNFKQSNIIAHSWISAEKIPQFISALDALIVPSRKESSMRETFSQVMVQGMLSAKPIIASNLPILTEKLDQGGGLVFNSLEELIQAITSIIENPMLRNKLGRQARKTALERYVWNTKVFATNYLFPNPAFSPINAPAYASSIPRIGVQSSRARSSTPIASSQHRSSSGR